MSPAAALADDAPMIVHKAWSPAAIQTAACLGCDWTGNGANATASAYHHARANPTHDVQVVRTSVGLFGCNRGPASPVVSLVPNPNPDPGPCRHPGEDLL